jgi:hypothetical protein
VDNSRRSLGNLRLSINSNSSLYNKRRRPCNLHLSNNNNNRRRRTNNLCLSSNHRRRRNEPGNLYLNMSFLSVFGQNKI